MRAFLKAASSIPFLVVDVDEEFESVIGHGEDMLPTSVSAEALERPPQSQPI